MFVVLLKFAENKSLAGQFMEGHNVWLRRGFDDGIFMLAGSLQPKLGGAILAHDITYDALMQRIQDDPFVAEGVVSAEILEITPAKADERLQFLCGSPA